MLAVIILYCLEDKKTSPPNFKAITYAIFALELFLYHKRCIFYSLFHLTQWSQQCTRPPKTVGSFNITDISLSKRFIIILETFTKPYCLLIGVRALILLFVEIIVFIESGTKIHGASVRNEKCACLKVTFLFLHWNHV